MTIWGKVAAVTIGVASIFSISLPAQAEGVKIYLSGQWVEGSTISQDTNQASSSIFRIGRIPDLKSAAIQFLRDNSRLLAAGSESTWEIISSHSLDGIETKRMKKSWRGIPVVGGDALVHFENGKLSFASADATNLDHLNPNPSIQSEEAKNIAFASYRGMAISTYEPELKVLILNQGGQREARLVYEVTVRDRDQFSSDIHFIDAQRGEEVLVTSNVHTIAPRKVLSGLGSEADFDLQEDEWSIIYDSKGCEKVSQSLKNGGMFDLLLSSNTEKPRASNLSEQTPTPCASSDARVMASALSAWNNSGLVHEYFQRSHNRNSIDNKGMTINSVVNFGGSGFPNAAWYNDKALMLYGFGDSATLNDFASPLDVVAHEITHGITSNSANLKYVSESGALNESYSDVFGKLVAFNFGKADDWKLGKDLFKDGKSFVRDMENPEINHVSKFMYRDQTCGRLNDFCGVHTNSGIPNRAAVLLAKKIGLEKLGKIYYLTLTQLLRSNSDFKEARAQTEAACSHLFGKGSQDCIAVAESFEAVGI